MNTSRSTRIEHRGCGIPIIYGVDAVHGHNNVLGATMFPHQIGLGATCDTGLAVSWPHAPRASVARDRHHWDFAPVVDMARDLRWGRSYETFGEDPFLAGELVAAPSRPAGPDPADRGRHRQALRRLLGAGQRPTARTRRSPHELQDIHLPPFKQGVDAGVETVMVNSGSVNGVPVHASHSLLTDVLRGQLRLPGRRRSPTGRTSRTCTPSTTSPTTRRTRSRWRSTPASTCRWCRSTRRGFAAPLTKRRRRHGQPGAGRPVRRPHPAAEVPGSACSSAPTWTPRGEPRS